MAGSTMQVILYEGDGAQALQTSERTAVMTAVLENGYRAIYAGQDGEIEAARNGDYLVLGKFDAQPTTAANQSENIRFDFRSLDEFTKESVEAVLEDARAQHNEEAPGGWKPWFPVIDYTRCTNCMQCLTFCLFDVYGTSEDGRIQVQNAQKCKTDCPACSRVCPEVAIVFPKYRSGPINGDQVKEEDLQREKMKVDISSLLGGNIYDTLKNRTAHARTRFAKERDESRALQERKKCLDKLKKDLDIPEELLTNLPSQDDIQKKLMQMQSKVEQ